MPIIHPAASVPEVSITPTTRPTLPLSTAQRQQLLITSVLDHSENYVAQPCPYPLEAEHTESSLLAYEFYSINPRAYPCLEQGEELQLRLEGDILLTAAQCDPLPCPPAILCFRVCQPSRRWPRGCWTRSCNC